MIYAKFHCDTEINCSINKQINKFSLYHYFSVFSPNHLEYLKMFWHKSSWILKDVYNTS